MINQKKLCCNGVHAASVSDKGMEFSVAKNFAFILQKKELENHGLQLVWFWERGGKLRDHLSNWLKCWKSSVVSLVLEKVLTVMLP